MRAGCRHPAATCPSTHVAGLGWSVGPRQWPLPGRRCACSLRQVCGIFWVQLSTGQPPPPPTAQSRSCLARIPSLSAQPIAGQAGSAAAPPSPPSICCELDANCTAQSTLAAPHRCWPHLFWQGRIPYSHEPAPPCCGGWAGGSWASRAGGANRRQQREHDGQRAVHANGRWVPREVVGVE